jgi:hypothetical protein
MAPRSLERLNCLDRVLEGWVLVMLLSGMAF